MVGEAIERRNNRIQKRGTAFLLNDGRQLNGLSDEVAIQESLRAKH
jgi:hypothetical protein